MELPTDRKTERVGGGYKKNKKFVVSVDRIDPAKGYTLKNTVLCCWIYNNLKQDLTLTEFFDAASVIYKNRSNILKQI